MKTTMAYSSFFFFAFLLAFPLMITSTIVIPTPTYCGPIIANDKDRIQFALNLEFAAAEFFCHGALGFGLDKLAPSLTLGGPPPIGAKKANLDPITNRIIEEFCYQEIGNIRAIFQTVGGVPRPLLNLSSETLGTFYNAAVGHELNPPFDPYANNLNFLLSGYLAPSLGLVGYVDTIPNLVFYENKRLTGGLLGVKAGKDGVFRSILYKIADVKVKPYNLTVAEFIAGAANARNSVAKCGIKDEGLIVPKDLGAENKTTSNILSADFNSLSYARTPQEILRILYGSGDESKPGGFLPHGGNGKIARGFLV